MAQAQVNNKLTNLLTVSRKYEHTLLKRILNTNSIQITLRNPTTNLAITELAEIAERFAKYFSAAYTTEADTESPQITATERVENNIVNIIEFTPEKVNLQQS